MELKKYYKMATFYPSIIVVIAIIIFSVIDNYNYKSEWLTAESVILFSILASIIYSLIISGLSLTIFLNKIFEIKRNLILSLLSWFLLPIGFITFLWYYEIKQYTESEMGLHSDIIYLIIITLPFIIGSVLSFIKYKLE